MKRITQLIILLFCLFCGCKKNSVEEQYIETVQSVVADLSTQVYASVNGFISDENGNAVEGAIVKAGNHITATDTYGYFKIDSTVFSKSAGFVNVSKPGYFTGTRTFLPGAAVASFIRLQLIPKIITGTFSAASGGMVSTTEGAIVMLPAGAVVTAANGAAYTGTVNVAVHWLNPTDMEVTQQTMPGDLRGIDSSGYLNILTTYGMLAVELSDNAGELLQIASGKQASLSFPLPSSIQASAPFSIPLWYFNESNGLWKQDGTAIKNGNNYEANVSHFSWWNCDGPSSVVNFKMQVVNNNSIPLINVPVFISKSGAPNSAFAVYSDAMGNINCMLPVNNNIDLKIGTVCNTSIYTRTISTTSADVDLGTILIGGQQYSAKFTGTVNNCAGLPVTNGYVIIAAGGLNQAVDISNGVFNAGTLVCPGTSAAIIAFDRDASQNSIIQNSTLITGINDFGAILACNNTDVETLTYSIDSGPNTTLTAPFYLLTANYNFPNSITNINAFDQINSTSAFDMNFSGGTTGSFAVDGPIIINQQSYTASSSVIIAVYGLIGEFITGSYDGVITDAGAVNHLLHCTFTIRRES